MAGGGRELAAEDHALSFQGLQAGFDQRRFDVERACQRLGRDGSHVLHPPAQQGDDGVRPLPVALQFCGQADRRVGLGTRIQGRHQRQVLGGNPQRIPAGPPDPCGPPRCCQLFQPVRPFGHFGLGGRHEAQQRIVQLVCVTDQRPGFLANLCDGFFIQASQVVEFFRREAAACRHGSRPPFFQRRVVQKRIRICIQDLMAKRRRFAGIAGNQGDIARYNMCQGLQPARQVHRLLQTVVDRLPHQGMIGNDDIAVVVFQATGRLRKDHRQQII